MQGRWDIYLKGRFIEFLGVAHAEHGVGDEMGVAHAPVLLQHHQVDLLQRAWQGKPPGPGIPPARYIADVSWHHLFTILGQGDELHGCRQLRFALQLQGERARERVAARPSG